MVRKITPYQYAIFLYEITSGKPASEVKKMTENFLAILTKNNDLGKLGRIIKEFEVYDKKQRRVKDVEIISARPMESKVKKQITGPMGGKTEIKETVNPDLIGGLTLIIEDMMIDGSLRSKLAELKKALT